MIVGHPNRRTNDIDPDLTEEKATSFRCFTSATDLGAGTPSAGPEDSFDLPKKPCGGGIRSNIFFPQYVLRRSTSSDGLPNL
jgi:hypothetical protein